MPAVLVLMPEPIFRKRFSREGRDEPEPEQTARWLAGAIEFFVSGGKFNSPRGWGLLGVDHGKRRFDELNKRRVVGVGGNQEFASNFGCIPFGAPESLAVADAPALLNQIHLRDRRRGSTTEQCR